MFLLACASFSCRLPAALVDLARGHIADCLEHDDEHDAQKHGEDHDVGLITLKDDAGINATVNDIVSNPKNLQWKEVEAATVPSIVADVDLACINGNYAIPAGFKTTDALATESATSLAAEAYANVLVVKDGNQDSDKIKALVKALTSDEVRTYINDTYAGAVVPVF